jgi:indole-3-glycerol phosphate synthase
MILDTIVERKLQEVEELRRHGIGEPAMEVGPPRGFCRSLTAYNGVAVIAEVKKASPSKGLLCADFDPLRIAAGYEKGGAQAISVLTDKDFFQGSLAFIPLIRSRIQLPVLRKDFIINELQIRQAHVFGADAILLIAAILDQLQLKDYQDLAFELGMDVLTEVHDDLELEKALQAGSRLVGINNRNLNDFSVDLETTFRLKRRIPAALPVVSESGIHNRQDMERLLKENITAALIGESLMRDKDPAAKLRVLMGWRRDSQLHPVVG